MINIDKQLVSRNIIDNHTYGKGNKKNFIAIHETANENTGANAQMHAKLQANGNSRNASWHYSVDDENIVQSFDDDISCWHASDGHHKYNLNGIAIEICVNQDGDYEKAVENAVDLVKYLMDEYDIKAKNVVQHYKTSNGKDCPHYLRAGSKGIDWKDFKRMIKGKSTKPKNKHTANLKIDGYLGTNATKALQRALGTKVDGIISGQYHTSVTGNIFSAKYSRKTGSNVVVALQKLIGAEVDGYFGSETVRKLQRYLGTTVDGKISKPSLMVKELQRRLNKGNFV